MTVSSSITATSIKPEEITLLSGIQSIENVFKFENSESVWMARSVSITTSSKPGMGFFIAMFASFSIVTPPSAGATSSLPPSGNLSAYVEPLSHPIVR